MRNLKRVFADHLFISEKILDDLKSDIDLEESFAKNVSDGVTLEEAFKDCLAGFKSVIREGACDDGLLSPFKPGKAWSPRYYLGDRHVQFVLYREKMGKEIVATISYADSDESPIKEMTTNRYKPTLKERIKHIFKKEAV